MCTFDSLERPPPPPKESISANSHGLLLLQRFFEAGLQTIQPKEKVNKITAEDSWSHMMQLLYRLLEAN